MAGITAVLLGSEQSKKTPKQKSRFLNSIKCNANGISSITCVITQYIIWAFPERERGKCFAEAANIFHNRYLENTLRVTDV